MKSWFGLIIKILLYFYKNENTSSIIKKYIYCEKQFQTPTPNITSLTF